MSHVVGYLEGSNSLWFKGCNEVFGPILCEAHFIFWSLFQLLNHGH
jgi:hypothetical protein